MVKQSLNIRRAGRFTQTMSDRPNKLYFVTFKTTNVFGTIGALGAGTSAVGAGIGPNSAVGR